MATGGGGADFVIKIIDQSGGASGGGGSSSGAGGGQGGGSGGGTPGSNSGGGAGGGGTAPGAPKPPPVPPPKIKPKTPAQPKPVNPPKPSGASEPAVSTAAMNVAKQLFGSMQNMYRSVNANSYQGAIGSGKQMYQALGNLVNLLSPRGGKGGMASTAASAAGRSAAAAGATGGGGGAGSAAATAAAAGVPPVPGGGGAAATATAVSTAARFAATAGPALAVAAGLAVLAVAVAGVTIAMKKLSDYALNEAQRLRGFSPILMQSGMREQLRDRMRNYQAAQSLGPGLAGYQDTIGGLKDSFNEFKIQFMRVGLQILNALEPFIAFASRMLSDLASVVGVIADTIGPFVKWTMEAVYAMFPFLKLMMKWARSKQGNVVDPFLKSTFKWPTPADQRGMVFAVGTAAATAPGNTGWVLPY